MSYSSLLFPCLSISMYPSISVLPNSSIRVETGDHSVPKFYVCTWTLPGPWAIIGVKTKTNLKDSFREQTFAALSSAAMRLHFYYDDTLWRVIKGRKKRFCHHISFCVSTNSVIQSFWTLIIALIIHYLIWSTPCRCHFLSLRNKTRSQLFSSSVKPLF